MRYLNMLLIALASALCATYLTLWLKKPTPVDTITTIPPLIFKEEEGDVVIWGGWKTVAGYQAPGANAVEIRCNRTSNTCHEAVATILHHDQGEDLEAQVLATRSTAGTRPSLRLWRSARWGSAWSVASSSTYLTNPLL